MRFFVTAPLLTSALLVAALSAGCGHGVSLDEPIEGPLWRLEQLGDTPVTSTANADPQREPQLRFDSDGRVNGSGGCNRLSGRFERSGSALKLTQLTATRMACTEAQRNSTEQQFFAALQTTASYSLQSPTRLALLDANGRTVAILSAR